MDETGQPGDPGPAEAGTGAESHDRRSPSGWATVENPWSNAGAALEPGGGLSSWRRPEASAPSTAQPAVQSSPVNGWPAPPAANGWPAPNGWPDARNRFADLMTPLTPDDPPRPGAPAADGANSAPASAPPYPYEGDLPVSAPPTRQADARHAVGDGRQSPATPYVPAPATPSYPPPAATGSHPPPAGAYEAPPRDPGYGTAYAPPESGTGQSDRATEALPQRVPAKPDVPIVPEPPSVEPPAETPALARIATHLRRDDGATPPEERPDGFDVNAILAAVREVPGVQDASLRSTAQGAHSLRLDLADGADAAEVSRIVARILQERMGLAAAMQGDLGLFGPSPMTTTPYVPSQATAAAREQLGPDPQTGLPTRGTPAASDRPAAPDPAPPASRADLDRFPADRHDDRFETSRADLDRFEATRPAVPREVPGPDRARFERTAHLEPLRRPPTAGGRATVPPPGFEPARPREQTRPYPGDELSPAATGTAPEPSRPIIPGDRPGPRVVIENIQVGTFGIEATVDVRLAMGERVAAGSAAGPATDGYLLRLCATATASAVDELLTLSDHADGPARCYVEHAATVPFGSCQVAVVVLLLSCGGWVEQLAGSAVVAGDDRQAMVRATLAAVNRRLEALLS